MMPRHVFARPEIRTAPPPTTLVLVPADHLRDLARLVERLGVANRTDPERITLAKYGIAHELRRLAGARR